MPALLDHFADLPDPRREQNLRHKLIDILTIAICAVICGAEGYEDFEIFGEAKEDWFSTFLELPNVIHSGQKYFQ